MSWHQELLSFVKRLLKLEERVEKNTEEIKAIRQDLKELTEFTSRVAYAVKNNRGKQEADHKILVLQLENELLKLENRLSSSSRLTQTNDSLAPRRLPEGNGRVSLPSGD